MCVELTTIAGVGNVNNQALDVANQYHESTKRVYLPLKQKPPAYKSYPTLSPRVLPTEFSSLTVSTLATVSEPTRTTSAEQKMNLTSLATLLFYSAGRIRKRDFAGAGEVTFRAASSAGGLYPIEVYIVCGDLPDLKAGVYHFSPMDFAHAVCALAITEARYPKRRKAIQRLPRLR